MTAPPDRLRTLASARGDALVLAGLLVLAALLRLPNLATRGTWDADQGHDMLVLRSFVRDGVVPLLGPPTSIGDVHHGAWYYYLLSPAAWLTGGDSPLAVVLIIALAGVAAVGVVWWLARAISGRVAALVAGLVLTVSAAAIDESTFIWNPNLIALSSAVALAGTWRAWRGDSPRWWLVAAIGVAVTMQCHVLGVALFPVVAVPFVLDARRRSLGLVLYGVIAVLVVAYLPLLANELTTDFSELAAALDYLGSDREAGALPLPVRAVIVGLRVVSWPLVGLVTSAFVPAVVATAAVIAIVIWRWRAPEPGEQRAVRWLGLGLLWSTAFLAIAAPSLASVVPGLPNDHYHAFADPMVVVLVGIGAAAIVREAVAAGRSAVGVVAAGVGVALLVGWNVTHLPPAVHPDGGWPAGEVAGDRVIAAFDGAGIGSDDGVLLRSLPDFKSTEAVAYPLARRGWSFIAETPQGTAPGSIDPLEATSFEEPAGWVLLCDDRFAEAIGAACGGQAEDAAATEGGFGPLLDRFEAQPDRWVSVYGG